MVPHKVHLHNEYGDIIEEGVWYRFGDNVLLRFDDPVELSDFAESIRKDTHDIVNDWRNYTE